MYRFVTANRMCLDVEAKDQLEAYRKLTSAGCPRIVSVWWYLKGPVDKRTSWKLIWKAPNL